MLSKRYLKPGIYSKPFGLNEVADYWTSHPDERSPKA